MKKWAIALLFFIALWLAPTREVHAGFELMGEVSLMISYSKTNFGENAYTTSRRYMGALSVYITPLTQIELSYTHTDTFFNYDPVQTTDINEQALGLSVIQALVPREWVVQPYGKAGIAQYNRKQSGTVAGIPTRPTSSKSPSAILGAGVRIFLLRNFSLKVEAVTFLPDMKFGEADDNFSVQGGMGWHF
ncbi:MAG: outer membrane beta-barrel protein [Bdellovibrionota bacterium]